MIVALLLSACVAPLTRPMLPLLRPQFERKLTIASAARPVLSAASKQITEAQASRCFDLLRTAPTAAGRAAAVEVCSTALKRFASTCGRLDAIIATSRDESASVRAAAVHALEHCVGLSFEYKKNSAASFAIASTRADHNRCTERLLELRADECESVRELVDEALQVLAYKEGAAMQRDDGSSAKRTRRSQA